MSDEDGYNHHTSQEKGEKDLPLPKFGEWDVNDPSSAEGYTMIFNNARNEKKLGGNIQGGDSPAKESAANRRMTQPTKPETRGSCCCFGSSPTQP